ncbi:GIY-YIG nuclease family protein [Paenibacillus oenotherae]|uniref:GIY-YIG nuclease family protein n=1 Tax=Paenibacillus oenotherae TaxID=1435645 RepID=A0ABS7D213_9BACL|nr:GIY-YIG nuclease family protein [Paenibacillus oenotherae]MBW7473974.1 GIY-YIG nuclease family protein [Paenibacillus oenotherae]
MDKNKRKELQEAFKEIKTYMGAIQIKCSVNGKIFVKSYPNLKNKWSSIQTQLNLGQFLNIQLQKDWKELGSENFTFEVLEQKDAGEITDMRWELKKLEKQWVEKLQPYGDSGYNKAPVQ